MDEREKRKERSLKIIRERGVPFMEKLPAIETAEEISPRSAEEIARRAAACLCAIQVACDLNSGDDPEGSRRFFKGVLEKYGVENELTEKEKAVFYGNPEKQDIINMIWKYEAYWVLLWALGIVDGLNYPDSICDCDFAVRALSDSDGMEDFMKKIKLKNINEILDEADLIFRYDWACVDARLKGLAAPAGLHPGVVFERHWGLNWLISKNSANNDWDSVSTDT